MSRKDSKRQWDQEKLQEYQGSGSQGNSGRDEGGGVGYNHSTSSRAELHLHINTKTHMQPLSIHQGHCQDKAGVIVSSTDAVWLINKAGNKDVNNTSRSCGASGCGCGCERERQRDL